MEHFTREHVITSYSIQSIAEKLAGTIEGDASLVITGIENIEIAGDGQLTFVGDRRHAPLWLTSKASAALVNTDLNIEAGPGRALIRVRNAEVAMALALKLFEPQAPVQAPGIHPAATVDSSAIIGEGVSIGAGCYVGAGVHIGAGTRLYPNVTVLDGTIIGAQCILWPGVVIRDRCKIGNHCILHLNVSIGGDGFGFCPAADGRGLMKIPHIGTVELGNDVEIGSNSCVDRGKFSATIIGAGTKIDNLVQIGHNCRIGRSCVIAACTGVAGSVTMGDGVMVGGCVAVKDHITIGSGARIGGGSGVMSNVAAGQTVVGYPATEHQHMLQQWVALRKLPSIVKAQRKG